VDRAKVYAGQLIDLLGNRAAEARRILADHRPRMTRDDLRTYLETRNRTRFLNSAKGESA